MWKPDVSKPVIFIVGPTASGKTNLSIQIAKAIGSEIISADSRYFYRLMDIGTAKPGTREMGGIQHHMIDVADPDETISVAVFKQEVIKIINRLHDDHKIPLVVGGTGQYVRALLHNWEMPVVEADHRLRDQLEKYAKNQGKLKLYEFLFKIDPEAAKLIDYRNVRRTIRAIEVMLKSGEKFSNQRRKESPIYSHKIIGIRWDRSVLYQRIDDRIEEMIAGGFIEEVRKIINLGFSTSLPCMSAIGYREIARYIQGESTLDEAILLMKRNSRTYVRRQANWFKESDPNIRWFEGNGLDVNKVVLHIESDYGWIKPE